jgi:stalled ribosome rescue protein Dom34
MVGLANVCLLTEHMTILRQRIEVSIPRKDKGGSSNHDKVTPQTRSSSNQGTNTILRDNISIHVTKL